ncbi:N-acetylmuramoyl-L-alanine amidase [Leptotrichia sp. oral taxon 218]|jgi:N-acetylmuramoyl-L-alanine amidase|uniref:N-acetylmuramoyl-L-alanine amidase family protein n=1 Tax=Leptotrichia sp. oral taxon 218 TaxID=712361 RepID=UPI001B8B05F5|nr:N-acetylmuramoyl-L-alanine amidase [Leptotrichia sp. oral taxon 218]QUB95124.1 N-acetylmuramoyl-L-alanine amidase [Leptotrichia sp. oral taxon 218]
MKKILIFLLFLVGSVIFAENLESINYGNGTFRGTFKENKKMMPGTTVTKVGNDNVLILSFWNTKASKVPQVTTVNDQYISKIQVYENDSSTSVMFYLKPSAKYQIVTRNKEVEVTFSGSDANYVPSQTNTTISSRPQTGYSRPSNTGYQQQQQTGPRYSTSGNKKYTIVVDPGHGGHDSGARGNGYNEKDIALQVATRLANNLRRDYNVIMTRDSDFFVPLDTRAKIGNDANADFFISIHLNSGSSSSANGTEVFYFSKKDEGSYAERVAQIENRVDSSYGDTPFSDLVVKDIFYRTNQKKSQAIATTVLDNLINTIGLRRRGVFGANFAVLRGSNSPSILVELGFMNNYGDLSQYLTPEGQERAAQAIADGIRQYFR